MQVYMQIQVYLKHYIEQKQKNKACSSKIVISIFQ